MNPNANDRGNDDSGTIAWVIWLFLFAASLVLPGTAFASGLFEPAGGDRLDALIVDDAGILPVDEAFRAGSVSTAMGVDVFWQVAPGHFLYRDKFKVVVGGEPLAIDLPRGEFIDDETFGYVEVLNGFVTLRIEAEAATVSVHYQGCAARGFCYPPQKIEINSGNDQLKSKKPSF